MANPKNLDSSDRYNPMETPPPVSDAASSGKKKCYSIFTFFLLWAGDSDSPEEDTLGQIRDKFITAVANYLGLWEWVVRLFGGIPPFEGGMTISCECSASDDDLNISTILRALKAVMPNKGRVQTVRPNNPYLSWTTSQPSGGKRSVFYSDYEVKEHDCNCRNWPDPRRCHGKKTKDFDDITDSSRSYTDSAGGTHDLGGGATTRMEKIQKIADAEKKALKSFTCCTGRKKGSSTVITQIY